MNVTQVEIERIQSRLQQLGTPRQATKLDNSAKTTVASIPNSTTDNRAIDDKAIANLGSSNLNSGPKVHSGFSQSKLQPNTASVGLPSSSRSSSHTESAPTANQATNPIGVSATAPRTARNDLPGTSKERSTQEASLFSPYAVSSYKTQVVPSKVATQCRSVEMNEEALRVLSESAELDQRSLLNPVYEAKYDNSTYGNLGRASTSDAPPHDNPVCDYASSLPTSSQMAPVQSHSEVSTAKSSSKHHTPSNSELQNPTRNTHPVASQRQSQTGAFVTDSSDILAETYRHLSAQAQRVNAISTDLQVALQKMGAIAEQVEYQRTLASVTGHSTPLTTLECVLDCPESSLSIPIVERQENGTLMVKALTISNITHHSSPENLAHPPQRKSHSPGDSKTRRGQMPKLLRWLLGLNSAPVSSSADSSSLPQNLRPHLRVNASQTTAPRRQLTPPANHAFSPSLTGTILWLGGSIFVRIGLDALLLAYPMLWPPAIALVITPAAIAIYRTTVAPQSSFLLGRRLLLIMIGLLIGGRL